MAENHLIHMPIRNRVRPLPLICVLLFLLLAPVLSQGIRKLHTSTCGNWEVVYSPSPNGNGFLTAITHVPGTAELWSVGIYNADFHWLTLIEHWDGASWQVVPSPNHPDADHYLRSVFAVAPNDVWTVGRYDPQGGGSSTLILHWDGVSWSIIPSPNPTVYNELRGVVAAAPNDVWAVGYHFVSSLSPNVLGQQTLIEHWDGASWSIVSSPNVGTHDNLLQAVAAMPNTQANLWAVGYYYRDDGNPSTLIMRWDGIAWSVVPSPDGSTRENYLTGVSSVGENDAWSVGYYNLPSGLYLPLTEQWDGTSWQVVPSPSLSSSLTALAAVSSISSTDVWAVGSYFNDDAAQLTLAQHWDGISWQVFSTPNPAGTDSNEAINVFSSVANVPGIGVWAGGYYQRLGTQAQTLTAFYCPIGGPTPTPSPTPTATSTPTTTPSATPTATATARPTRPPRSRPTPAPRPRP